MMLKNRAGFTLMELLVYMGILGVIVLVAGEAFSNSTKFRIRTDNMIKANQEAENVAALLKTDVMQTGAKTSKEATVAGGEDSFEGHSANIYIDPDNAVAANKDYSSFKISPVAGSAVYDTLMLRYVRYDESGHYLATEQVNWYVDVASRTLKRSCKILDKLLSYNVSKDVCSNGAKSTPTPVDMASGVQRFKVYPAIPAIRSNAEVVDHQEEQIFPPGGATSFKLLARVLNPDIEGLTVSNTGSSVTLSVFANNYNQETAKKNELYVAVNTDDPAAVWNSDCQSFTLEPNIEYEISFVLSYPGAADPSQAFVPGRDHMSVGFRNTDGTTVANLDDFFFYPPTGLSSEGTRTMRFTVPEQIAGVCMAFTFATYSPLVASGSVVLSNLKLKQVAGANYTFDPSKSIPIKDKKNVKALRLELQIGRGEKNNQSGETGNIDIVVPIPSNGAEI